MKLLPTLLLDGLLIALCLIPLVFLLSLMIRRGRRAALEIIAILLACVAFVGLLVAHPTLGADYLPDQSDTINTLTLTRGVYAPESDSAGNRFVWTQDHATFLLPALPRKPITITFDMRSAAVAGGPDVPIQVEVNGVAAGQLRPDPTNMNFQPLTLRIVPYDWGGQQTEIKLVADTFRPGKGDGRVLGTMIKGVSVDMHEAWSGVSKWRWLLGMLPVCAMIAIVATWFGRRRDAALSRYAAVVVCVVGAGCAFVLTLFVVRAGVVAPRVYQVWILASVYLGALFVLAAALLPLGPDEGRSLIRRAVERLATRPTVRRAWARIVALRQYIGEDSQTGARRRTTLRDLRFVFVVALGIRLIWAVVLPPWMAIDETEHFAYVNHIVEQRRLPGVPLARQYSPYSVELQTSLINTLFFPQVASDPDLITLSARPLPVSYNFGVARTYTAPDTERYDSGAARATPYPPLYYLLMAVPDALFHDQPVISRVFAMRVATALIGALSCIFAYLFAYELRRTRLWGWSFGLCIAFMPTYAHITASINNDAAVDAIAIVVMWLMVRSYRRKVLSAPIAFAIGALSGLSLLSKPNGVPLLAIAGLIVLARSFPFDRSLPHLLTDRLRVIGLYVIGGVLTYGPWVLFRLAYYGDFGAGTGSLFSLFHTLAQLPLHTTHVAASGASPFLDPSASFALFHYSLGAYFNYLRRLGGSYFETLFIDSFWGIFGWGGAILPVEVLTAIKGFCAVGAVGIIAQFVRRREQRRMMLLLLGVIASQVAFMFLIVDYYESFARTGAPLGIQGRYFLPMLVPLLYLLLSGWDHLCNNHPIVLRAAPLAMLALDIAAFASVLTVHYGVTG